jgi:hypothetical protein
MQLLLIAAAITLFIAAMHSYLGERRFLPRLLASADLPRLQGNPALARSILRWAWHLTSVAWVALALLLMALGRIPGELRALPVAIIAACLALSGLVCLVTTRGRHVAWPLFMLAAGAAAFSF